MSKLLLRVEEAAQMLSLGRSKAYELIRAGKLPAIRVGRSVRVPLASLESWITEQAADSHGDGSAAAVDRRRVRRG